MKINIIGNTELVMENRDSIHNYFGWPTIARLKNGTIAVGASANRIAHVCPFGKSMLSYSYDDGKTFTRQTAVIDTVLDDRDTGLCPFGESGLIVTSFTLSKSHIDMYLNDSFLSQCGCINHHAYASEYLDHITEEANQKYKGPTYKVSFDNGITFSELYKSPVTSPHGPIELSDGTLLWVGPHHSGDFHPEEEAQIYAYKITTDGKNELCGKIPLVEGVGKTIFFCEPHCIQLPNGTIICHIRCFTDDRPLLTIYQTESTDMGKTWTNPHQILPDTGGAPAHLMLHSSGMLISTYGYREAPYGVRAMFSEDGGKTWDIGNDIYINNISGDLGYPSTIELSDKSLLTVFYAHENENSPAEIFKVKWSFEK